MAFTLTPIADDPKPQSGFKLTKYASDGSAAVRSVFPNAVVTSGHRENAIGYANDDHHLTHGAVDVAPIKGMTFDQFTAKLKSAGYPIIQAIDEVNHPSGRSTGPHWHVALGERRGGGGFTLTPVGGPQKPSTAPRPQDTPPTPKPAQRPANQAVGADPSLWESIKTGAENAAGTVANVVRHPIASAESAAKAAGHAIAHPQETLEGALAPATGAVGHFVLRPIERATMGKEGPNVQKAERDYQAIDKPWLDHPWSQFKKEIREHPISTAAVVLPGGRMLGKLGARGVEAARAASLSPEARAAWRARRAEEAETAGHFKNIARSTLAKYDLEARRATAKLDKHQKVVGNLPEEEQRKIAIAADTGKRKGLKPEYHPALDTIKEVGEHHKAQIQKVYKAAGKSVPGFVDNYYKHLWQTAKDAKGAGKQGSRASLRGRKFETLAQGLEAGLTPQNENPLHVMSIYAHHINSHLAALDMMTQMRKSGLAKWVGEKHIPEGYSKLDGIDTDRLFTDKEGKPHRLVLAAKEPAAKLYNRRLKPGLTGPIARGLQKASAVASSVKLLSFFHPTLIAGKAAGSDFGNGLRALTRGAPKEAVASLAHMPFAPALTFRQGLKMKGRIIDGEKAMSRIDKLYVEAGGRLHEGGMAPYHSSELPSHLESAKRGTFLTDFKRQFNGALKGTAKQRAAGAVKGLARTFGRALDSETDAVFKHYVPAVKMGAFEREMAESLKAHPEWGEAEQATEARKVLSNLEGRMGLIARDNLFWNNTVADISRIVLLSPSWQIGNARLIEQTLKGVPDSLRDLRAGKGLSHAPAQAMGLMGSYMLGNALLQYMYTGQRPQNLQDLLEARTGGTNQDGSPERVTMPSVFRELYGWFTDPQQEASNVGGPAAKMATQLATNEDWKRGHIYRPVSANPTDSKDSRAGQIAEYLGEEALPIPAESGDNPRSHVGALARIAGLQPVGTKLANPGRYQELQDHYWRKELLAKRRSDAKKKSSR